MKVSYIFFSIFFLFLVSCDNRDIYFQYQTIDSDGWNKDSVYVFNIDIQDTLSAYNFYIHIRNTADYPYQNLWLFLSETNPYGVLQSDTIEFYLADYRGKWLGSGAGAIKEMPVLYKQGIRFENSGIYKFRIGHGMRTDYLKGVESAGVRVEKIIQ